jgi:ureidoglycolate hydrolase
MYHFRLSMRVGNPSCFIVLWLCYLVVVCCTCDSEHCPATRRSYVAVIPETSVNDECAVWHTFILDIF